MNRDIDDDLMDALSHMQEEWYLEHFNIGYLMHPIPFLRAMDKFTERMEKNRSG